MGRFTPVYDPEKARDEQNENELRKHRQFDTPFAQLPGDLNEKRQAKGDLEPLGKPSGDLEQDEKGLWRKKIDLFEKKKTWGRETFEYSNPEEATVDGKTARSTLAGWGVRGTYGGRGADNGDLVLQRNEVDQTMVKNEKGLWVRRKVDKPTEKDEEKPIPDNYWRCPKCKEDNINQRSRCRVCQFEHAKSAEASGQLRTAPRGEDPRLEAAKLKGRGTADAAQKAMQALHARRREQRDLQDSLGLTSKPPAPRQSRGGGSAFDMLNSSSSQVKPADRRRKYKMTQGVQRTDDDAREVVGKAEGTSQIGKSSSSRPSGGDAAASGDRCDTGAMGSRVTERKRSRSCSWSLEPSRSPSPSPEKRRRESSLSPQSRRRQRADAASARREEPPEAVVDFF